MTDRDKLKIWNMQAYPSTPRKSWAGRVALGLSIAAVIALWSAVARADVNRAAFASEREPTHDAQGRYILRGDPDARPSPYHSGGGMTGWADDYYLSLRPLGPFRIGGEWFSAGTMVLALVAGPSSVPGSCLGNVRMSFHGSRSAQPGPYEIECANLLLPPLRPDAPNRRRSWRHGIRGVQMTDDDHRTCGHCGLERNVRSMSCMNGVWICTTCYAIGRHTARQMLTHKQEKPDDSM